MPLLLLWKRIDFSSDENEAPPRRTVAMNCSIVYCFTAPLSAGFFFGSGVCFVINALFDTSGFCSGGAFWADILETNEMKLRLATSNPAVAGRDKMKFDRHMAISCLMDFFPKEKRYCLRETLIELRRK